MGFLIGASVVFAGVDPGTVHNIAIPHSADFANMLKGSFVIRFRPTSTIQSGSPVQALMARNWASPHDDDYWIGHSLLNPSTKNGTLEFAVQNGPTKVATTTAVWNAGQEYVVVFTFDSTIGAGEAKAYVGKNLEATATWFNPIGADTNSEPLYLGSNDGDTPGAKDYYQGGISEFRMFRERVLTQAEVNDIVDRIPLASTANMIVHLDMQNNVEDKSGSGNHGTLNGASYDLPTSDFRQAITIAADPHLASDLSNCPIAIHVPSSNTAFWDAIQSDGRDVVLTAGDGVTPLDHEVESFDSVGDDAWFHVRIPSLSASVPTGIYLNYGNASAVDSSNVDGVWDSNHVAVFHLNADHPQGYLYDSSGNGNTLSDSGGTTDALGKIDRGRDFNDVSQLDAGSDVSIDNIWDGGGTVEFSAMNRGLSGDSSDRLAEKRSSGGWLVSNEGASGGQLKLGLFSSWTGANGIWQTTNLVTTDGLTSNIFLTYNADSSVNVPALRVDNVSQPFSVTSSPTGTRSSDADNALYLGSNPSIAKTLNGILDEAIFSNIIRSDDYCAARYQSGEGAWLSFGSEEGGIVPGAGRGVLRGTYRGIGRGIH